MNVATLSAGTWGMSLAALLHANGHDVRVWEYDPAVVETLVRTRSHPRLPGMAIPAAISISTDMATQIAGAEAIVCVVPAAHLRETCRRVVAAGYAGQLFIIGSKGIEHETLALPNEIAEAELGAANAANIGLLSGPSHAEEVSRSLPTAVAAAAADPAVAERIRALFMAPRFRVYTQTDVRGVELSGALKNVIAIACGISDGMGFGDNAKAGLITRGMSEIMRLGLAMGAQAETFFGLAGIGDLVVTCMSQHSRNWRFGNLVGRGTPPQDALAEVGMVVEGYYTVRAAVALAGRHGVEMPISTEVARVLFEGKPAQDAVAGLMLREPKPESPVYGRPC